jgi:fucose permease
MAGNWCKKFGSRPLILVTTFGLCLALPFLSIAPTFTGFAAVLFLLGLFSGVMDINMNAHAVLVERLYGRPIMSSFHGFFSGGAMLGGFVGSLAAKLSLPPELHLSIVAAILLIAALSSSSSLLPASMDKQDSHESEKVSLFAEAITSPPNTTPPDFEKTPIRATRRIIFALSSMALCSFVMEGAVGDWSAVYLHSVLKTSESFAALGFACFNVAMTIGRFSGDYVVSRVGPVMTIRFGALLAVLGLGATLICNTAYASLIGFAAVGLGLATIVPNVFSGAGNADEHAGQGIATVAIAGYAGLLVGPPLIGFTAEAISLRLALFLVCLMGLIVVGLAGNARPGKAFAPVETAG